MSLPASGDCTPAWCLVDVASEPQIISSSIVRYLCSWRSQKALQAALRADRERKQKRKIVSLKLVKEFKYIKMWLVKL